MMPHFLLSLCLSFSFSGEPALKPAEVKQFIKASVAVHQLQERYKKENPPEMILKFFKERNELLLPKYGFTGPVFDHLTERIAVVYQLKETMTEEREAELEFENTLKELKANGISDAKIAEMRTAFKEEVANRLAAFSAFTQDLPAVNQYRRQITELYAYSSGNRNKPPQF